MKQNKTKILFVMRSAEFFHYYRTIIEALLEQGCRVRTLTTVKWSKDMGLGAWAKFQKEHQDFEYGWAVSRTGVWQKILFHTRELLSYRRYALLGKRQSDYYKNRYLGYLPPFMQALVKMPLIGRWVEGAGCERFLRFVERLAPPDPKIIADIKNNLPDVVVASPVNMRFPSSDLEYLKAAKALRIPTALPVISWDNLTTKGLIHAAPDALLAWNDVQVQEAQEHQHIPHANIRIIGAPVFDAWFSRLAVSMSRDAFCKKYGLRPEHAIVTYLGSSSHMAENETWLVEALRKALDGSSDSRLQKTQMIVRPHPSNFRIYAKLKLPDVIILPEEGALPDNASSLQLFYDTLHYSAAAIDGANTSGIIDAIIAGTPGIAILTDTYRATQKDTQHFRQLLDADALLLACGPKEFPAALKNLLEGNDAHKKQREAFVARFIRPRGLNRAAGDVAAREILNLVG